MQSRRFDSTTKTKPLEFASHDVFSEAIDHYYRFNLLDNCPIEACGICRAVKGLEEIVGSEDLAAYLEMVAKL